MDFKTFKELGLFNRTKRCIGAFFASFILLAIPFIIMSYTFYNEKIQLIKEKSDEEIKKNKILYNEELFRLKIKNFELELKKNKENVKELELTNKEYFTILETKRKKILELKNRIKKLHNREENIHIIENKIKNYYSEYSYSFLKDRTVSSTNDIDKFNNARTSYDMIHKSIEEKGLHEYFKPFINQYHLLFYKFLPYSD